MMPELEPLEADVLALLRAAKPIAELEPTAKAAILASVEARIGLPPTPGGGGGNGDGGAGGTGGGGPAASGAGAGLAGARAIAAIAATFAIGVATGLVAAPSVSPPPNAQVATPNRAESPPIASANLPIELPAVSVGSLPAASAIRGPVAAKVESPETPAPSARGLGAERSLLDVARAALARGESAEALAAVDRHSREYPDGVLVEEREALAIKALVALGRRDEARARAQRFEQRFPNGLMLRAVKGAVGDL